MANKKKKRPAASGTGSPSQGQRIAQLERHVAAMQQQLDNMTQFVAYGVANQLQEHLLAHPEDRAKLEAAAAAGPPAQPSTAWPGSPFLEPTPQ